MHHCTTWIFTISLVRFSKVRFERDLTLLHGMENIVRVPVARKHVLWGSSTVVRLEGRHCNNSACEEVSRERSGLCKLADKHVGNPSFGGQGPGPCIARSSHIPGSLCRYKTDVQRRSRRAQVRRSDCKQRVVHTAVSISGVVSEAQSDSMNQCGRSACFRCENKSQAVSLFTTWRTDSGKESSRMAF